ncbi:hypothetical protein QZH41_014064, partial [Actinostola sp. cb2023]
MDVYSDEDSTESFQPQHQQAIGPNCKCRNTCSRKRSARSPGCPCQNAAKKCSERCACGTKKAPCKNREDGVVVNNNPSALACHREAVENTESEIKEFIRSLSMEKKDSLLVRLLSQGRGSLEFAQHLVDEVQNSIEAEEVPWSWCVCQICREMESEK